jgi:hypothetical protein
MGLSDFHPRPARVLADRPLRELAPAHGDGSPVLTRESLARMSTPPPRRLAPVRGLLAPRTNNGLRPLSAGWALAEAVSRPARRSLRFQPACSLVPFGTFYTGGFDPGRCRPAPLRLLPAGTTVAGWATFLPRDSRALLTAHDKVELKCRANPNRPSGAKTGSTNLKAGVIPNGSRAKQERALANTADHGASAGVTRSGAPCRLGPQSTHRRPFPGTANLTNPV